MTAPLSVVARVIDAEKSAPVPTTLVEGTLAGVYACTNAVVASCVVFVPGAAVGPAGTPVKVGLASSAPPALVMSAVVSVTAPTRPLKLVMPAAMADTT